jgi:uncharacterized protein (TIGR02246 family)
VRRFVFSLAVCLASAALAASAQADPVRDAVDAGNYFFLKGFAARDAQAIADLYTEDGRVVAPGAPPAVGRAAIAAFWAATMRDTQAVRLETLSVEAAGDLALEEGVARLVANDGSESTARYLVVWKREGRRWHLYRDIWNVGPTGPASPPRTDEPAPAETPSVGEEPT